MQYSIAIRLRPQFFHSFSSSSRVKARQRILVGIGQPYLGFAPADHQIGPPRLSQHLAPLFNSGPITTSPALRPPRILIVLLDFICVIIKTIAPRFRHLLGSGFWIFDTSPFFYSFSSAVARPNVLLLSLTRPDSSASFRHFMQTLAAPLHPNRCSSVCFLQSAITRLPFSLQQ